MPDRLTSFASVTAARSRLFRLGRLVSSLFLFTVVSAVYADDGSAVCAPETLPERFSVDYIHDGDTLWLRNGNKVRIIGLNAPETVRGSKPAEPFGTAARDALRKKIGNDAVYVETGAETHDRYGRQLVHIFLADKTNLTAWLLSHGFAMAIAVPPNLKYQDCYQKSERVARDKRLGIWADAYFEPVSAARLSRFGFTRVQGCVQAVSESRDSLVLALSEQFHIRILAKDRQYLQPLLDRVGETISQACVVVRGWVYNERLTEKRAMNVRHPDAIEFSNID